MSAVSHLVRLILVLGIAVVLGQFSATAKETITWLKSDLPPLWIVDGSHAGDGLLDVPGDIIRKNLPDYEHVIEVVTVRRAFLMLEEKDRVCSVGRLKKPGREKVTHASLHLPYIPGQQLVTTSKNLKLSGLDRASAGQALSLERVILEYPNLVLGLTPGRSFGFAFDSIIKENREAPNILWRAGPDMSLGLLNMLLLDRIGYTIEYPTVVQFMLETGEPGTDLAYLPLAETGEYDSGTIVCSKTDWGKQMIERVNSIMATHAAEFISATKRWVPANQHADFERVNADRFEKPPTKLPGRARRRCGATVTATTNSSSVRYAKGPNGGSIAVVGSARDTKMFGAKRVRAAVAVERDPI